ncbi:VOC family protein [Flavobacterium sp. LS1R47]|jgi:catechol 2,3-dioxygenase-like lactoylglutathione lyase family enzyme|uniref:VOC family protein n=1 Tax=Flavobacterium frigoritolerans TaxID=2987686 RepID=A0A9X3C8Y7_9FLAO|nr:VOC family protein [Flavobacterium frigoritolerans]MCV9933763.1 VOC family protein [Flavobacterium frigoritolerans]
MTLRVARHTNDLKKLINFYIDILGFERLGGFENHNNYDGAFIGKPNLDWHFEFTKSNDKANHTSDEDDALVLYPETILEYNRLVINVLNNDMLFIKAKNPYWNENGKMFLDPDGFRIIISSLKAK